MTAGEGVAPSDRRLVLIALAIVVAALWIAPLPSSFWTDETVTAWVLRPGLGDTLRHAVDFQAPPPLTFAVIWASAEVFGSSEWAMRIPSLLAIAASVWVVARLGRRLFGAAAGWWGAAIFCCSATAGFLATDARPYAMATLALLASTFFLVRWFDDRRWIDGVLWVLCTALVFHTAYIFAPALVGQLWFVGARQRRERALPWGAIAVGVVGIAALVAPLVPFVLDVAARNDELAMRIDPTAEGVLRVIPAATFGGVVIGLLLARWENGRLRFEAPTASTGSAGLTIGWLLAPPLFLAGLSAALDVGLFTERYLACTAPAIALLAGWLLEGLRPAPARRLVVIAIAVASLIAVGTLVHTTDNGGREDWREAMSLANGQLEAGGALLMDARLIEASAASWLRDPERASYTMAPLAMYPALADGIPMPSILNDETRVYLEEVLPAVFGEDRVILVSRNEDVGGWLQGRFEGEGYAHRSFVTHGVQVTVFERPA